MPANVLDQRRAADPNTERIYACRARCIQLLGGWHNINPFQQRRLLGFIENYRSTPIWYNTLTAVATTVRT